MFHVGSGTTVTISGLNITNGNATGGNGGGIFNDHATLTVSNCLITGNAAGSDGGGVYNDSNAMLTVANSTLSGNSAVHRGGAIHNFGALTVINSTLSGNSATSADGGAIFTTGFQTITVINSTLSGNSAGFNGGGIDEGGGLLRALNSTFSGNSAAHAGGGIHNSLNGTVEISNTILKAGAMGANLAIDSGSITISDGYNLSSDDGAGFLIGPGDQINTDPTLGPLQDNGGPTLTHALLPGSPAIDTGDPVSPRRLSMISAVRASIA